jgi:hypothetical protein
MAMKSRLRVLTFGGTRVGTPETALAQRIPQRHALAIESANRFLPAFWKAM